MKTTANYSPDDVLPSIAIRTSGLNRSMVGHAYNAFMAILLVTVTYLMPSLAHAQTGTQIGGATAPLRPDIAATAHAVTAQGLTDTLDIEIALRMRNFGELQRILDAGGRVTESTMQQEYLPLQVNYTNIVNWLKAQGFTIVQTDPRRLAIFARATVAQIQNGFGLQMTDVTVDGINYHTATKDPILPSSVAVPILSISGLQPYLHLKKHTLDNSGDPLYLAPDIYSRYNLNNLGVDGSGQTIGILIDQSAASADLQEFWGDSFTLGGGYESNQVPTGTAITTGTTTNVTVVNVTGTSNISSPEGEETLDEEWSGAIAPGAHIRVYATGNLDFPTLDEGLEKIISDVSGSREPLI